MANKTPLRITKELVSIPSVSADIPYLHQAVDYAQEYFRDVAGVHVKRYEENGKPSIVISTRESRQFDVLFLGHLDVVPGLQVQFDPQERDGRLWGRGTCDMKGAVAACMSAFEELASGQDPPCMGLALTTDEEIGGPDGGRYLIEDLGYTAKVGIVPDNGTGPLELVNSNKGVMHLGLTARGKTAHASRKWHGRNAIEMMVEAMDGISRLFPPTDDPERWYDTYSIGTIQGGSATNQVAEQCQATLDIRFVETSDPDQILESVKRAAGDVEIERLIVGTPCHTSPDHPALQAYQEVVTRHFGKPARVSGSHGNHDGRFLSARGVPLMTARHRSQGAHSEEEWLDIQGLQAYRDMLVDYVKTVLPRL